MNPERGKVEFKRGSGLGHSPYWCLVDQFDQANDELLEVGTHGILPRIGLEGPDWSDKRK